MTLVAAGALLLAASPVARADSVVADFSLAANPNGNWTYGYTTTLGGSLNPFSVASANQSGWLDEWTTVSGYPAVGINTTATTQGCCGTVSVPPGILSMHPDNSGAEAVVRWTAPAAGGYEIQGLFEGLDYAYPTTTDVHILLDSSTELFGTEISDFENPSSFSLSRTLAAGDTIDFVVGVGTDGSYIGDTTGLIATIRSVPEPSTLLLLGTGLLGLFGAGKGSRRSRRPV